MRVRASEFVRPRPWLPVDVPRPDVRMRVSAPRKGNLVALSGTGKRRPTVAHIG